MSSLSNCHDNPEITTLTYEQCRQELENIVEVLEQGGHDLDTALMLWERAEMLATRAQEFLEQAHIKITQVIDSTIGDKTT